MDKRKVEENKEFDFIFGKRWVTGIPYEVTFWRSYYRRRKSREALISWSQLGKECTLDNFDVVSYIKGGVLFLLCIGL